MKKIKDLFLPALVSLLVAPLAVWGAVFTVHNPAEFQNALATAQANGGNDTINVAPGTYNITSTLKYTTADGDGALTIQAQDMNNRPVLDGGKSVQIMYIDNDSDGDYNGDEGDRITIKGLVFKDGNCTTSGCLGGGLYAKNGEADTTLDGNAFKGNYSQWGGGGAYVYTFDGTATIINNTFNGNFSDFGGGAYQETSSGTLMAGNNTFSKNSARWGGGGVNVYGSDGTAEVTNNIFSGNSAGYGGGIHVYASFSGTVKMTNNTINENSAHFGAGTCFTLDGDSVAANIYNNILWGNTASKGGSDGDDLYIWSDKDGNGTGATVNLYNNDLGQNSDFSTGQSEDLYITVTDKYHHASNIKSDPLFVDPSHGNFHLKSTSPCMDKGLNSAPSIPSRDFEGDLRIVDGNGDGNATVDMGADEYTASSQEGNSTSQNSAAAQGVAVVRVKNDGTIYLYVPSLLISVQGNTAIYELLFRLEDLQSVMFRMEGARALSTAPGPVSAYIDPGQELFYAAYVALIDNKGNTTIFKNITFFVTIGKNETGQAEAFINLRDLVGDQMPTITEYIGGTKQAGSGVPPEISTYYLDMMQYLENIIKGTSLTTPQAPASSSSFTWDIQDW